MSTAAVKTERITILGTPEFKSYLAKEAQKEGISLSKLVRQRCSRKTPANTDQELLAALLKEVNTATARASKSLSKGLREATQVLAEIRSKQ